MTTNGAFLQQKLQNYKTFVASHSSDPEKVTTLDQYDISTFLVFGSQSLLPLSKTERGLDIAVTKTIAHFSMTDTAEVRSKLHRYYQFLVDFLSQETTE